MPENESFVHVLGLLIIGAPALLITLLGIGGLLGIRLKENVTARLTSVAIGIGLIASLAMLSIMLVNGQKHVTLELGNFISVPHFHFSIKLLFDYLSLPFVILSFVLSGVTAAFSQRYLHREPGYDRFYLLMAIFVGGMVLASVAGTIETLFAGWEMVGLSSALLVAFFQERPAPVRNGLRVWVVYRVSDAALLVAAVLLHHLRGEGDFDALFGTGPWEAGHAWLTSQQAFGIGLLLLIAAAGKSALIPFCGWLPRAMEGPTPSSAVFYGALSVHLGAYLLLRAGPLLVLSPLLCVIVVVLGLSTALLAAVMARTQTDIKSALSYASLTQVGLIVAEIGLGLRWIALAHIVGHACLRTLQFLRAPMLLQDYRMLENAIGSRLTHAETGNSEMLPIATRNWLYRASLERGYLDAMLNEWIARPIIRLFQRCDRLERRFTDYLSGGASRESDRLPGTADFIEELS